NHESPRRGQNFVTRKISHGLTQIKLGHTDKLLLGNLDAQRDWGYTPDFVEGMYLMMQTDKPDDYVLATGETHSVREFVEEAAKLLDFDLEWQGIGLTEKGIDKKTNKTIIAIDEHYFRPAEVDVLLGDYSKAKKELDWEPKTKFKDLVKIMVEADLNNLQKYGQK
ncbi:MAG: GDP-mannose 4,6-dehydratase, partial [Flavobacteriaceae bacterium]|nr:GDP-mannose 4,6-dehydratase [Flavobacteriaceae bacterium]